MRFINSASVLRNEFRRLANAYDNYNWMVAWAGEPFEMTRVLIENEEKINRIIIGLHFYQTHPDFVDHFNENNSVRFIHSTSGTFHPKVYLFSNDSDNWELLIGSANFTNAAFNSNNEACVLIRSDETNSPIYDQVINSIDMAWGQGRRFTDEEKEGYRRRWETQLNKATSLGTYLEKNQRIPFYQIPVVRRNWREYIDRMFEYNADTIEQRLSVLDYAQEYFSAYPIFSEMPPELRKRIGGYVWVNQPADFRLFGTMQNATTFTNKINNQPESIGHAIDVIPLFGEVTREQYDLFVERFNEAVDGGNKYRSATRLLSMKRPDLFFCLSSGNNTLLAEDFEIQNVAGINFSRYWDEIIERIKESNWYQHPEPANDLEERIVPYRAAFMDAMYYQQID
ncbi:MAG: phospholipase D family protein [Flavisolibacter sp.]